MARRSRPHSDALSHRGTRKWRQCCQRASGSCRWPGDKQSAATQPVTWEMGGCRQSTRQPKGPITMPQHSTVHQASPLAANSGIHTGGGSKCPGRAYTSLIALPQTLSRSSQAAVNRVMAGGTDCTLNTCFHSPQPRVLHGQGPLATNMPCDSQPTPPAPVSQASVGPGQIIMPG